eukprot:Sdes_comp19030_c0_seq1m9594
MVTTRSTSNAARKPLQNLNTNVVHSKVKPIKSTFNSNSQKLKKKPPSRSQSKIEKLSQSPSQQLHSTPTPGIPVSKLDFNSACFESSPILLVSSPSPTQKYSPRRQSGSSTDSDPFGFSSLQSLPPPKIPSSASVSPRKQTSLLRNTEYISAIYPSKPKDTKSKKPSRQTSSLKFQDQPD